MESAGVSTRVLPSRSIRSVGGDEERSGGTEREFNRVSLLRPRQAAGEVIVSFPSFEEERVIAFRIRSVVFVDD